MNAIADLAWPQWVERLEPRDVPVLQASRDQIARWRSQPEQVDAHQLAEVALCDPYMALRVLAFGARRSGSRLEGSSATVTAALVLGGIEPFFAAFEGVGSVEESLAGNPEGLAGVHATVLRALRSARLAAAFAIHRQDEHAAALHEWALLHDFASLLLWWRSPDLANAVAVRVRANAGTRTVDAQRTVLGCELSDVARRLVQRWHLPASLEPHLARQKHDPRARTVHIAVQIARHLASGWSNPSLPDDMAELGALLHMTAPAAAAFVREVLE